LIVDELIKRDFIDWPDELIEEQLYFKSTHALEELFVMLEESNLFCIHRLQEAEAQLD
jgi:hypothetical protein